MRRRARRCANQTIVPASTTIAASRATRVPLIQSAAIRTAAAAIQTDLRQPRPAAAAPMAGGPASTKSDAAVLSLGVNIVQRWSRSDGNAPNGSASRSAASARAYALSAAAPTAPATVIRRSRGRNARSRAQKTDAARKRPAPSTTNAVVKTYRNPASPAVGS